jgi:hypothetical protein
MSLQMRIDKYIKNTSITLLPAHCICISDVHASGGGSHDVLNAAQSENVLLDKLDSYLTKGYTLLKGGDWWDYWRGGTPENIQLAHPQLVSLVEQYKKNKLLYEILGNHEKNKFSYPEVLVFKGFGKTIFFDHGFFEDFPNDYGWWIGRTYIYLLNLFNKDPLDTPITSPHPENEDRHQKVVYLRNQLANNNPSVDFLWGHTHCFQNDKNNHNSGSPTNGVINGTIEGFLIEEGNFIPIP